MWILIDTIDYLAVKIELIARGIESINPHLNVLAIPDTERNRRICTFLVLQGVCSIEEAVGLDRVLAGFVTEHPKRVTKMA